MLEYAVDRALTVEAYRDLLIRSTLGERRPVEHPDCLARMVAAPALNVTCWDGEQLVGLARSLTDYSFSCYLADLAVDRAHQRSGIGRELVRRTRDRLGPHCSIILLAAPMADSYYGPLGFKRHERAWVLEANHGPIGRAR
ncbi:MAG: GNAT family N-acetyltransferase [Verrucomicrobiales bacterium]|nr:GNAT family N-acetyltransferase [Verrucomicrobiales bacterium]